MTQHRPCRNGARLIKWVIGVGIAQTLAVGGMIWTATQVLLRALPNLPPHP